MDSHSLKVLEYDAIVEMLRERTACALGDDLSQQLQPSADEFTIREALRETSEAVTVINEEGSFPLGGIHDIRPLVTKAAMDALLQPSELLDVAETLASGRRLRSFVLKRSERCPKLAEIAVNIGQFPRIEEAVRDSVAENGEIRSTASPELARIRSKLKTTHSRMIERLHSIIQSHEFRTIIQDPVVTQRGDRYCIPVKSEFRYAFPGIVHDSSASGATVFIEPASVIDMGNDLKELAAREQQEIEKILRRLTGMVAGAASEVSITLDSLGRLDFASAKGRLSADMDATEPDLNTRGEIRLVKARHPLLQGEVVPIDLELGRRFKALLITGPNTGGKTVSLKTTGLLTLMAQSGLHIPADQGSEVAVFEKVFADIGDEQSIQQSLSTFSAHLRNIVRIVQDLGRSSLVLLDEIGAGTDPGEGAALAKAILDHLIEHGAITVATTHYGELKEFAFARDGVENASVEFDVRTLRPTYKLMIGVPGSSNAFAIAARLGLPEEIVHRAGELVSGGETSEAMIRRIEESYRSASEREQTAERASRDADILRSRYEERLGEIDALRREMRRRLTEEIDRRVREKVAELDGIIEELKTQAAEPNRVQEEKNRFRRRVKEIREELDEILPGTPEEMPAEPFVLRKGDRVKVVSFDMEGDLLSDPDGGEANVMVGNMKVSLPVSDLRPARKEKPSVTSKEPRGEAVAVASAKRGSISAELKLIAQRAEQAIENLDKYLDDAYLAGLPSVRIIHGKGTGALRKAVWEYLATHHAVESYRLGSPEEGGAGATVVEFRK